LKIVTAFLPRFETWLPPQFDTEGRFAVKGKCCFVEQIVAVLKQVEMVVPVLDLGRQVETSEQTIGNPPVWRLKQFQEEKEKLKKMVAESIPRGLLGFRRGPRRSRMSPQEMGSRRSLSLLKHRSGI
jgi:putative transposase